MGTFAHQGTMRGEGTTLPVLLPPEFDRTRLHRKAAAAVGVEPPRVRLAAPVPGTPRETDTQVCLLVEEAYVQATVTVVGDSHTPI